MDVNQSIVKVLEQTGKVDCVFGSSGQVNASMLLYLKKSNIIKTIIVRNEQAASFMACGYSMFSDKLGVCFATAGPGAFNLFSGLAVAYNDSLPVLGITGYVSKGKMGKGALNETSGLNRTANSEKMFSAITKKSYTLKKASEICDVMEEAINIAYDGRPGPVHIHIPKDIAFEEVNNFREIKINIKNYIPKKENVMAFSKRIEQAILNNEQAVILIGYGCIRSNAKDEILKFVNTYKIPFMSTMDAKGYLPENHELSLGVFGSSGDLLAKEYFTNASLVLAMGNSFAENATFSFKSDLYNGKTLMHINIDRNEINKVYTADYSMVSDIKPAIKQINEILEQTIKNIESNKLISPIIDKNKKYYNMPVKYKGSLIHPAEICKILSDLLPENSIVLGDAGSHMLWLSAYMSLNKNQLYQNPGSFGPMAVHTNGAIGVKCANPNKTVISACGDGCYLMSGFELLTAVQNQIPVIWIIFNNGELNIIKKFLLNMFNEYTFMDFKNPDYSKYAQACGAKCFKVEKIEDFKPSIEKAIEMNCPVIIDVIIENNVYPPMNISFT